MIVINTTTNNWQRLAIANLLACLVFGTCYLRLAVNPPLWLDAVCEHYVCEPIPMFVMLFPSLKIADLIQRNCPGKSKSQISTFIGMPKFKERSMDFPGCARDSSKCDEVWCYEIGWRQLIMIEFKEGKCISASSLKHREEFLYQKWKSSQLKSFAVGKTETEIESKIGRCFVKNKGAMKLLYVVLGRMKIEEKLSDSPGRFYTGTNDVIELEMKNGRCTQVEALSFFY